jgi:A/G-specific adenine glycosylase
MERTNPLKPSAVPKFRRALLAWYDHHHRDLPWRKDTDPYHVWLSEIMLQQTRVEAVRDHYARFLQRFPTVEALARSREASVLAMWSGLGYYHRARRMHQAAKVIVRDRRSIFPSTAEDWHQLPGIGRYTAAAIASIAFNEPIAVVDGNVERVLARMFGAPLPPSKAKAIAWHQAQHLLAPDRPGDSNQAMMELGATICTPRAPQCLICPVHRWCQSRGEHAVPRQPPRKRKRLYYGLARQNGSVLLVQRPANASLMAGMWELPVIDEALLAEKFASRIAAKFRHSITDTDYEVSVLELSHDVLHLESRRSRWLKPSQWERLPLTGLARKILRRMLT